MHSITFVVPDFDDLACLRKLLASIARELAPSALFPPLRADLP